MKFRSAFSPFLILVCFGLWCPEPVAKDQVPSGENRSSPKVLSLSEALTRVLERNPELSVSELEIQAASARILQAGVRPNPEFAAEIQNLPAISTSGLFRSTETTFQMSQRLELAGKRAMRVRAAEKEKGVASSMLEVKKVELIAATGQAFANTLADQERLSNQQEMTRLARQSHSIVVDRVAAGKVSPVEQTRAAVMLASAQLEEAKQLRALLAAKDRLAALWGGTSGDLDRVEGRFEISSAVPGAAEACSEGNPDLMLAAATVESRRASLALEETARKPDLIFSAGFHRLNLENISAWVAGVSIPLPLFDKRQGAIAEARIRLDKAFSEKKALEWRLRAGLAQARHDHEIALLEAKTLTQTALPAAREALAAIEEGYRLGKFDYLNVLDAQRTYAELQRRYIEAVASGLKAVVEIERFARCNSQTNPPKPAGDIKDPCGNNLCILARAPGG